MSDFNSLTLALDEWFDKPQSDMPDEIRQRVEQEFSPISWDRLAPNQRRSFALQRDYQGDPATEQERQYWWDHFCRKEALEKQIAEWSVATTPTASDLAQKEARLAELKKELARMEQLDRQEHGDYYPGRNIPDKENPPVRYIAYPKAMKLLVERWNATLEELAAWIFMGPKIGGLAAYTNANELNPPPRFNFGYSVGAEDYLAPLMSCWFMKDDIANFQPVERYITGQALIERWSKQPHIKPKNFIVAKIHESRLSDIHPTFGLTRGSTGKDLSPPLESGLFSLSEVNEIEADDFLEQPEPKAKGEIILPQGTSYVSAADIPELLANAIHPGADEGARQMSERIFLKEMWSSIRQKQLEVLPNPERLTTNENHDDDIVMVAELVRYAAARYAVSVLVAVAPVEAGPVPKQSFPQTGLMVDEVSKRNEKPWLIHNPDDPEHKYPWYTPARFFARGLVREDSTLLTKRDLLAKKVAVALKNAGFMKRGGIKPLDPTTVKKAFSNVSLG